jgi:hypothetical protein
MRALLSDSQIHGPAESEVQWGSTLSKRVFDDFKPPGVIYQRHVKSNICQLTSRFACQKLLSRGIYPGHLPPAQPFGCAGDTAAFLDFNKYQAVLVSGDQINLTRSAAPSSTCHRKTAPLIVLGNLILCRQTSVIVHPTLSR